VRISCRFCKFAAENGKSCPDGKFDNLI